ncbi:hypothetical protein [Pandoravirus japonicus]|uniref:Uncharacterized protein n=1 Tax=Pandoravirus japonicus TaxID=2823154 RepID=A0A811BS63_9VIRU|nr:hypothetical protein [Pandoravirus japonicus]
MHAHTYMHTRTHDRGGCASFFFFPVSSPGLSFFFSSKATRRPRRADVREPIMTDDDKAVSVFGKRFMATLGTVCLPAIGDTPP